MPELPEVEFARGCLTRWLGGKRLDGVEAERTRVVRGSSPATFEALAGHRVERVDRRGKWLLWTLDSGLGVLAHLGMTGKFILRKTGETPARFSRVRFVTGGVEVDYQDPRMFGRMAAGEIEQLRMDPTYRTLGPDAWDDPPTPERLQAAFEGFERPVKDVLGDQTIIAGLGNIQATEALFRARLHPARPANSLSRVECRRLVEGIHWTLARSLAMNKGDSITYVEEPGEHENPFLIYGKAGEPCPHCGTTIRSMKIGGRTCAYCPKDQPAAPTRVGRQRTKKK